jgi:hypothetical protein
VDSPTKTEPPFVPLRHTGWATHRTPLWVFAAVIVLIGGVVVLSLSHTPSTAQRAGDLSGYLKDVNAGIESCAGGTRDSMTAFNKVQAGDRADLSAALGILAYNAQNCSPANNEPLSDFAAYQVTESLAFPDALNVQQDMTAVLKADTPAQRATAQETLTAALAAMDAQRAAIYGIWRNAEKSVGSSAALPFLPA